MWAAVFLLLGVIPVQSYYYCALDQSIYKEFRRVNFTKPRYCCEPSARQWDLIAWYFRRVSSYINVTEIKWANEQEQQTLYASHFISDLYSNIHLEHYSNEVVYRFQHDHQKIESDTYMWNLEPNQNITDIIADDIYELKRLLPKVRDEAPDIGSIVIASDIEIIYHHLNSASPPPFNSRRAHYVIFIYREIGKNWHRLSSAVLSKLWHDHGIMNAIILASCSETQVNKTRINWILNSSI